MSGRHDVVERLSGGRANARTPAWAFKLLSLVTHGQLVIVLFLTGYIADIAGVREHSTTTAVYIQCHASIHVVVLTTSSKPGARFTKYLTI